MKAPPAILIFQLIITAITALLLLLILLGIFSQGPLAGHIPLLK